jgi:hypothetical protein
MNSVLGFLVGIHIVVGLLAVCALTVWIAGQFRR